ncbi:MULTISPECIES: hypothetical protein [Novosphingobium]|uniref:hypothetical protein n=1 Tax=unclassified Novosphingobium TaxID=2644732 RepID=UPI000AC759B4|nr:MULTISPECIES: hypothetical protein [unclassified Novosphingobium]MPS69788.1 hypothetical protein [Novosphingobium sp.]TCM36049.1 hypothetical protein EDF59_11437 [Novosphingobium sp. ST904]
MPKDATVYSIDSTNARTAASRTPLTDQLSAILAQLSEAMVEADDISLDFKGKLMVHLDVKRGEDLPLVEAKLSALGDGMFSQVSRGATPHHPFSHRVTALVTI